MRVSLASLCPLLASCATPVAPASVVRSVDLAMHRAQSPPPALPEHLARRSDRATLTAVAVARDPAWRAQVWRARSLVDAARAEGSLGPPELSAQLWNAPLSRPWNLRDADMVMVELRRAFTPAGFRGARARAMAAEAEEALAMMSERRRTLSREVSMAWTEYVSGDNHHRVHATHLAVLDRMTELLRSRYSEGHGSLDEVVRIEAERARTRRRLARFEADRARAGRTLNALLRRDSDAPLGAPAVDTEEPPSEPLAALITRAVASRPELRAGRHRVRASAARVDAAHSEASTPTFTGAVGYWQDPMARPGFGLIAGMTLPWLASGLSAREQQARSEVRAVELELDERDRAVRVEVVTAHGHATAVSRELLVLRDEALPAARRAEELASDALATGRAGLLQWLEASQMTLELAMDEADLVAELSRARADLAAAVGEGAQP